LGVVLRRTIINENTKNSGPPKIGGRGRKNVKEKLIRAACAPLSDRGPRAFTMREIAKHAGVNHDNMHYYFKQKRTAYRSDVRTSL
jgi:AcrR family transcriptional regulator